MAQPIRSSAANTCFDFVEGQLADGFLGGNERKIEWARNSLSVVQAVGNEPQRQRLHGSSRSFLGPAVSSNAWESRNICQPPAVLFPVIFNGE